MEIDYNKFYDELIVRHCNGFIHDINQGLRFLWSIEEQVDAITYNREYKISLTPISDSNTGKIINPYPSVYEYKMTREYGDIYDNFFIGTTKPCKIIYLFDDVERSPEEVDEILFISAPLTDFRIRFIFSDPLSLNDTITFRHRAILLTQDKRISLMNNDKTTIITTKHNVYKNWSVKSKTF